jgi:hypothetical protein
MRPQGDESRLSSVSGRPQKCRWLFSSRQPTASQTRGAIGASHSVRMAAVGSFSVPPQVDRTDALMRSTLSRASSFKRSTDVDTPYGVELWIRHSRSRPRSDLSAAICLSVSLFLDFTKREPSWSSNIAVNPSGPAADQSEPRRASASGRISP